LAENSVDSRDDHWAVKRHGLLLRKHLLRNYSLHAVDGGLFMGGTRFRAEDSILPVMVATLGGPTWLIGLTPILGTVGFALPLLFVAHYIERLKRHLPWVLLTGSVQRLAYLATGVVLVLLAGNHPLLAAFALAGCPFVSGLTGGFGSTAWQELVADTVPPRRRASLWAVRNTIGALIGVLAGYAITIVVARYGEGNPVGYGVLHFITFGFTAVSMVLIACVRETPYPRRPSEHTASLGKNLRQMPAMVRGDHGFVLYLGHTVLYAGMFAVLPFMSIHALTALGKPEEFLGSLLVAQMAGQVSANVLGGFLGDRFGGKLVATFGLGTVITAVVGAALASEVWQFLAVYLLLGAGQAMNMVGRMTLNIEICPVQRRASYLAVMSALSMPAMLLASQAGSLCWWLSGKNFLVVAGIATVSMCLAFLALLQVDEPRNRPAPPEVPQPGRAAR
jgi:MFS family permease